MLAVKHLPRFLPRVTWVPIALLLATGVGGADSSFGGGGLGEPVVRNGVWAFDILSDEQRAAPVSCENTLQSPFGDLPLSFGWQTSEASTVPPRVEPILPGQFGADDSHDVGGHALVFYDEGLGGFQPNQISLAEGPPIDIADLGIQEGSLRFAFSANSPEVPPELVFVVGSRVLTGTGWSPWIDLELPILSGPHDYRVPLEHVVLPDVQAMQNRVGVKNNGPQPLNANQGPAVDRAEAEAEEESVAGAATWKYVPDITQGDDSICQGTAFANCISYWSQNGYEELAPEEGTQEEKNEAIQDDVVEECHTNDKGDFGATEYLKEKGVYRGQDQPEERAPLEHVRRSGSSATFEWFKEQFEACHDVLLRLQWYDEEGELVDEDAAHYVTAAGLEITADGDTTISVANPWGESHHEPDEDSRDDAYDDLEVSTEGGMIRVDNNELETRAEGIEGAEYLCVESINVIRPVEEDRLRDPAPVRLASQGPGPVGQAGFGNRNRSPGGQDALVTYDYGLANAETTPLDYAAMLIEVPYENVQSPPGWDWQPLPAQYPASPGCGATVGPAGILWTTATDPIPPGGSLGGFSFDADESYPSDPEGLLWYTDTEGLAGNFGFVTGPVPGVSSVGHDGEPLRTSSLRLRGAHPNPFSHATEIAFDLAQTEHVRIDLYDIAGRHVVRLADRTFGPGRHRVSWDGRAAGGTVTPPGIYFARTHGGATLQILRIAEAR